MKKKLVIKTISKLCILSVIGLLCYPAISDIYDAINTSHIISEYEQVANEIENQDYMDIIEQANRYNEELAKKPSNYELSQEEMEKYKSILNIDGNGLMGTVIISKINVELPIYHTAEKEILKKSAGHIPGSSIPVGGKSTHSIILAHTGMVSAKLFTELPKLEKDDIFQIRVLNEIYNYQVDQITTVYPNELENLKIIEGQDYCTLVTCVPIGVNDHRLLVRGHRVDNNEQNVVTLEKSVITKLQQGKILSNYEIYMVIIAILLFIIGCCYPFFKWCLKSRKERDK